MNVLKAYEKFGISKTEIFQGVREFFLRRGYNYLKNYTDT